MPVTGAFALSPRRSRLWLSEKSRNATSAPPRLRRRGGPRHPL